MKQHYKTNMITRSQRVIASFLLICQLLTSCGGKQEMMIIPNTFSNDHQKNCIEKKEDCKSTILAIIEETKASSVTNQVPDEVTRRSSSTFVPASQPMSKERVNARLKMKNTSSTHNRMASKPFSIPIWQKAALFGIAMNNTFAYASRPYAFNKEPNQHQISSEPEELASTASTDPVQPKTVENDLQIPTSQAKNKRRPVFDRAKIVKPHSIKGENSFYDPLMNSSLLENTHRMIEEFMRDKSYARKQAQDRGMYLLTAAYVEKKILARNVSKNRIHNAIETFSSSYPVWTILLMTEVYLSCTIEKNLMEDEFSRRQDNRNKMEASALFFLQCNVNNDRNTYVDIEFAMSQIVKDAQMYYADVSTETDFPLYGFNFQEGIDLSLKSQQKDFNSTLGIQYYPLKNLQDNGNIVSKIKYKVPPNTSNLPLLQLWDTPGIGCLTSLNESKVKTSITRAIKAQRFSRELPPPYLSAEQTCYPKSQSKIASIGDFNYYIVGVYKVALNKIGKKSEVSTSNTAYRWAVNLRCLSTQGAIKTSFEMAPANAMSVEPYNGGLEYLNWISQRRTMDKVNEYYIPPLKIGSGYELDDQGNCVEIVDSEGKREHDELMQIKERVTAQVLF